MPFLDWVNKNQAVNATAEVPYHLLQLEQVHGDVADAQKNTIIQGDNLQALKALLPFYTNKVKCIFIDPPYNTQSAFDHYDDKLEHSQWLSLMYPRLVFLRELLADDGSLWITVDDNEAHYLKVICDEIFGRSNFVRNIVWQKKYTAASDSIGIPDSHDHIFVYRKSKAFSRNLMPRTDKQNSLYKYDDLDGRGPWRTDNLSVKTYSADYDYDLINPLTGKAYRPPAGRCWMTNAGKMATLIADKRVFFGKDGKGAPQLKRFLNEVQQGVVPISWWPHDEVGHNDESRKEQKVFFGVDAFSTPKPERLLERIIHLASNKGDLILDSFAGSGTTGAVAHKMGRNSIMIEQGNHCHTHIIPRFKKVIEGEQGGVSKSVNWLGGGGFSFYTLGEAVFDANGHISPTVRFNALAAYIWLLETKTAINTKNIQINTPFIGEHEEVAYYLLYNGILGDRRPNGGNVLTSQVLAYLNTTHPHQGKKVIFGEASRLGETKLNALGITFKQIPYELHERV